MKRSAVVILLLIGWLLGGVASQAHEGEKHEDVREAAGPSPAPAGSPRVQAQTIQVGAKSYLVTFRQTPAESHPGVPLALSVQLEEVLNPPDPLLGERGPATVKNLVTQLQGPAAPEIKPVATEPGLFELPLTPPRPGLYRLGLQAQLAEGALSSSLEIPVSRTWERNLAWWAGWGSLALLGLVAGLEVVRGLSRPHAAARLGAATTGLGLAAAGLLFWGSQVPPVASAPPTAEHREATTTDEQAGVQVPEELQRRLRLRVVPAQEQSLPQTLEVPGQLEVAQGKTHRLASPVTGRVVTASFPQLGDRVEAGQVLATVEEILTSADRVSVRGQRVDLEARRLDFESQRLQFRRSVVQLEAEARVAQSRLAQRRSELLRAQRLFEIQVLAEKDLVANQFAVEQARRELEGVRRELAVARQVPAIPNLPPPLGVQSFDVVAPITGTVSAIDVASGETVDPSQTLFEVDDLTVLWARARVPERDLGLAEQSRRAEVRAIAYPGRVYNARLVSLGTRIDPESRTASAIYALPNPGLRLLSGLAVRVRLLGGSRQALTVPAQAVLKFEGEERVFVQTAPDRFQARTVKVQERRDGRAWITEGLQDGSPVLVEGAGQLASELARRGGSR